MPYMMMEENGQFCVYKKGPDGKPEGKVLGKHPTKPEAEKQMAALYANMKDETKKSVLETLVAGFKGLMDFLSGSEEEGDPTLSEKEKLAVPPKKDGEGDGKLNIDDETHVADAITALSPEGFRGNQVKLSSEQRSAAISRISSRIDSLNIPAEKKAHLHERLNAVKEIVSDIELGFKIVGNHWRAAWTNNFEDRARELFSMKAIDTFINDLDRNPQDMPELWAWHKAAPLGKAEVVARIGHIVIAAGKFYDEKPYVKQFIINQPKRAEKDGMSHGYWYFKDQLDKTGVYHQFKTFEITVLPKEFAANPYTNFAISKGGKEMLSDAQKAYFKEVFGDEADAYFADVEAKSSELEAKNIRNKELEDGYQSLVDQVGQQAKTIETLTKENADLKQQVVDGLKAVTDKVGMIESFLKFEFNQKELASKSDKTAKKPEEDPALDDLKKKNEEQQDQAGSKKDLTFVFMPFLKPNDQ